MDLPRLLLEFRLEPLRVPRGPDKETVPSFVVEHLWVVPVVAVAPRSVGPLSPAVVTRASGPRGRAWAGEGEPGVAYGSGVGH